MVLVCNRVGNGEAPGSRVVLVASLVRPQNQDCKEMFTLGFVDVFRRFLAKIGKNGLKLASCWLKLAQNCTVKVLRMYPSGDSKLGSAEGGGGECIEEEDIAGAASWEPCLPLKAVCTGIICEKFCETLWELLRELARGWIKVKQVPFIKIGILTQKKCLYRGPCWPTLELMAKCYKTHVGVFWPVSLEDVLFTKKSKLSHFSFRLSKQ